MRNIKETTSNPEAKTMTINNVSIGDVFSTGKHSQAKVVDFLEQRSMVTGIIIGYVCIAQGMGLATNQFPTPFATVCRNRIAKEVA